jgi:prepilin-type N-terminal cleavage/methylation domain-containing protein
MFKTSHLLQKFHRQTGFTLLELLVVISIIGILIAISSAAFSTAQKKSRDAKRRGDIKTMQNGFEQYYAQNDGLYANSCAAMVSLNGVAIFSGGLPKDPKTGADYSCPSPSTSSYCICATLETGGGNATALDCGTITATATSNNYFCMANLQ